MYVVEKYALLVLRKTVCLNRHFICPDQEGELFHWRYEVGLESVVAQYFIDSYGLDPWMILFYFMLVKCRQK